MASLEHTHIHFIPHTGHKTTSGDIQIRAFPDVCVCVHACVCEVCVFCILLYIYYGDQTSKRIQRSSESLGRGNKTDLLL